MLFRKTILWALVLAMPSITAYADAYKDAIDAFREQNYAVAYEHMLSALEDKPKNLFYLKLSASLATQLEKYPQALDHLEQRKILVEKKYKPTHQEPIENALQIALVYGVMGDTANADAAYNHLLTNGEAEFTEKNPMMQDIWDQYSLYLRDSKQFEKSNIYINKILADKINRKRDVHYDAATLFYRLGLNQYELNQLDAALENFKRQFTSYLGYYTNMSEAKKKNPNVFIPVGNTYLGPKWFAKSETERAIEYYDIIYKASSDILGDNHLYIAVLLKNYAQALSNGGQDDKALDYANRAHAVAIENLGADHSFTQDTAAQVTMIKQ